MNRYLAEAHRLLRAGQFMAAAELCRKSIKMQKDTATARTLLADCHYNLGVFQQRHAGLAAAAEEEFRRALEIDPSHADAANNLGAACLVSGRGAQALDHFRKAALSRPRDPGVLANVARSLVQLDRLDEAATMLRTVAQIDRANEGAYLLCEAMLVAEITPDESYPERIREQVHRKLDALADQQRSLPNPLVFPTTYFPLSYHGTSNLEIVRKLASIQLRWSPSLGEVAPHVPGWVAPGAKAKVAIASRFLRNHSIGNTSRGLVEKLDRDRFDVTVIRFEPSRGDETSLAIDEAADHVVTLPPGGLDGAREAIARLGLDVLFYQDIGMEPLSYGLALARLAPVQLTSYGHPDTTGIPNLDFFVSAENYERPGAQQDYSERLVEIPGVGTLAYYHRPRARAASREDFGFGYEERLYLCPQTLFKLQPAMDRIFDRIAADDPRARIVLIASGHEGLRSAVERRVFRAFPALRERITFVPSMPFEKYLDLVSCADVLLDTVHFNGQNTTLEALALGIPVVTWPGSLQRSRHGYGIHKAMGFTDLVASGEDDYVRKAVRVAGDREFREECRRRIAESCGVLFENRAFIASFEEALAEMMRMRSHRPS